MAHSRGYLSGYAIALHSCGIIKAAELIEGGAAAGEPDSKYPAAALAEGVEVEKEHTPNPEIAKEIAKDHIEEFRNYYPALEEMEKKLKAKKEASLIVDSVFPKLRAQ